MNESVSARRTRGISRAPKFWPMIGPMEPVSAKMTPNASGMTRSTIAPPATVASPRSDQTRVT